MTELERDLTRALAPSAGLHNRLVHEYEALDDACVFASIEEALDLFPEYIRQVVAFLES